MGLKYVDCGFFATIRVANFYEGLIFREINGFGPVRIWCLAPVVLPKMVAVDRKEEIKATGTGAHRGRKCPVSPLMGLNVSEPNFAPLLFSEARVVRFPK
jgi:hypothetical protein